jgi:hypothetical protein
LYLGKTMPPSQSARSASRHSLSTHFEDIIVGCADVLSAVIQRQTVRQT